MFLKKITEKQNSEKYGLRDCFLGANSQVMWERLDQWRAKGSDAGPHLKTLYKEAGPIFK